VTPAQRAVYLEDMSHHLVLEPARVKNTADSDHNQYTAVGTVYTLVYKTAISVAYSAGMSDMTGRDDPPSPCTVQIIPT